jgi:putative transposase
VKQRHHTPEQIVRKVAEGQKLLAEGRSVDEVAEYVEVTPASWYRWVTSTGSVKADDAERLRELEKENQSLKKIVADQALDMDMLGEVAQGKF